MGFFARLLRGLFIGLRFGLMAPVLFGAWTFDCAWKGVKMHMQWGEYGPQPSPPDPTPTMLQELVAMLKKKFGLDAESAEAAADAVEAAAEPIMSQAEAMRAGRAGREEAQAAMRDLQRLYACDAPKVGRPVGRDNGRYPEVRPS